METRRYRFHQGFNAMRLATALLVLLLLALSGCGTFAKQRGKDPGPQGGAFVREAFGLIPAVSGMTPAVGPPPFFLMSLQPSTPGAGPGGIAPPPTSKGPGPDVSTATSAKDEDKEFVVGA